MRLLSLALVACSSTVPAPATTPSTLAEPTLTPVEAEEDDYDEPQLTYSIEPNAERPVGTIDLVEPEEFEYMVRLYVELVGRRVQVEFDQFELANHISGHGAVMDYRLVSVAGGAFLVLHQDLDMIVDPPRFTGSRWSEAVWIPPNLGQGGEFEFISHGAQHAEIWVDTPSSVCISGAFGDVLRVGVNEGRLAVVPQTCARRVAEQPEATIVRRGGGWETLDEYLDIVHAQQIGPRLWAIQAGWIDEGQYDDPRQARMLETTRLVWEDGPRIRWWYLALGESCFAGFERDELVCGTHRYAWNDGRLDRLSPLPNND